MKKKIYYVVNKEVQDIDGFEECTGNKTVGVYMIVDNELKTIAVLELDNSDSSELAIKEELDENGLGISSKDCTLIQL